MLKVVLPLALLLLSPSILASCPASVRYPEWKLTDDSPKDVQSQLCVANAYAKIYTNQLEQSVKTGSLIGAMKFSRDVYKCEELIEQLEGELRRRGVEEEVRCPAV